MRMTQLKTIADIQTGPFGSQLHKEDYVETGTPIVTVEHLGNRVFTEQNLPRVSDSDKARLIKYTLSTGDIVFSRVGSVDRCSYVDKSHDGWMFSGRCLRVRPTELVDSLYLYYYFCLEETKQFVRNIAVGATMPSINTKLLGEVEIALPDLNNQKRIAAVLSSLDDKIENNQKLNDNLQQQARAIYKEWFIDFGQTSGTTPATWKHGKLKDVLQLHKRAIKAGANTTLPYLPIDTIPMQSFGVTEFRPNDEAKSSLITFQKDDIIVGAMRVYFHRVVLAPCDGITRTTCFTLSPYNSKYLSYALLTCDLDSSIDHAQNTSKGSTMPYAVWDGGMGEIEIVIPPIDVAEEFNNIVLPMLRQIQRNCEEIKLLGSLRDTLLPKLMSGEIDVSGIQL